METEGTEAMLVYQNGNAAVYELDGEFYVYAGQSLKRVCPSIGMAREVAAGWSN
jgi:hypothetical protein